jgi:pyrroloquinoline quinone biosynthesis protein B
MDLIGKTDYAFLDATFYKNGELKRDISEIPHPFVEESMDLFSDLSEKNKQKVYFIHFNHTNPLLINGSHAQKEVRGKGFNLAREGQIIEF